jgi:hypothetical protein
LRPLAPKIPLDWFGPDIRRINAYREKARIGLHETWNSVDSRPLIFLDADIIITDASFFDLLSSGDETTILASPSAWDRDLTWTYKAEALPVLRQASGLVDLTMQELIPNSGVLAAWAATWRQLSMIWAELYDSFLTQSAGMNVLHESRLPGDQEFLALACKMAKIHWQKLHGSFNMQVDPARMRWLWTNDGQPMGGHLTEKLQKVRAVHFGCNREGKLDLPFCALGSEPSRAWLRKCVDTAWSAAVAAGLGNIRQSLT